VRKSIRSSVSLGMTSLADLAGLAGLLAGAGPRTAGNPRNAHMQREIIRVEPLSTDLEKWKAPTSAATRHGDTVYVTGAPPFVPETGEIFDGPIERQAELVLEKMKECLEAAGSDLDHVLKCNVYCTSVDKFAAVNVDYTRYFPKDPPARIFIKVARWPGPFDIDIDCVAVRRDD
jgi:2-iminobutanoate/2-iminopropanoate deaminase